MLYYLTWYAKKTSKKEGATDLMYRVLMTESQDMIRVLKARRDVSLLFMSPSSIFENKAETLSYT